MENNKLNIISAGLQNALVIDNDEDSSIFYKRSEIDSEFNPPKIDDISELLYNKDRDPFMFDTFNCIQLILDNGSEISLHKYTKSLNVKFLKIITSSLNDNNSDIVIACDNKHYLYPKILQWQTEHEQIMSGNQIINVNLFGSYRDAKRFAINNDLNGFDNCDKILQKTQFKTYKLPAIDYCNNIIINTGKHTYQGYLPSIGQLHIFKQYISVINRILQEINIDEMSVHSNQYWSSTEASEDTVWYMNFATESSCNKFSTLQVLPFFKKIK